MRAIKSVLVIIGTLKRAEPQIKGLSEESLLMRALRDFNAPKIVQEDEVIMTVKRCPRVRVSLQSLWVDEIILIRLVRYSLHFMVVSSFIFSQLV